MVSATDSNNKNKKARHLDLIGLKAIFAYLSCTTIDTTLHFDFLKTT